MMQLIMFDIVGFQESYFRTLKTWFGQMNALQDSRQHKSLLVLDSFGIEEGVPEGAKEVDGSCEGPEEGPL
jgi:hypothetical protein